MLCDNCTNVLTHKANYIYFTGPLERGPLGPGPQLQCAHHCNLTSLEASAAQGCHVCIDLWSRLSDSELEVLRTEGEVPGVNYDSWLTYMELRPDHLRDESYVLGIHLSDHWNAQLSAAISRFNYVSSYHLLQPPSQQGLSINQFTSSSSTDSEMSFSTVDRWLQQCLKTHSDCQIYQEDPAWRPTRLLDLGDHHEASYFRVILTSGKTITEPYCTLSHCWGSSQPLKLTRETEDFLLLGTIVHALPRTFKEAIAVTKRLGIRYLWIDSLCIMQDDRSDWLRESALMDKVYQYGYCNISADDAADSSQGLYRSRNPHSIDRTEVEVCIADFNTEFGTKRFEMHLSDFWYQNLGRAIILPRGWVYQERYLSPRVLHFGQNQLLWECHTTTLCESYPESVPDCIPGPNVKVFDRTKYDDQKEGALPPSMLWNHVVTEYSRCSLTYPGDRLVALSGIAKRFKSLTRDSYVAGMWRNYLVASLLWSCSLRDRRYGRRSPGYRAPTWSWASIDEPVSLEYDPKFTPNLIEVENVELKYETEDDTGALTGGWLDLRCIPRLVTLAQSHDRSYWKVVTDKKYPEVPQYPNEIYFDLVPPTPDVVTTDIAESRLFIVVASSSRLHPVPALFLRLADIEEQLYERIGMVVWYPPGPSPLPDASLERLKDRLERERFDVLDACFGVERKTIKII